MHLIIVGINHDTASIALREQVAFTPEQLAHGLKDLKAQQGFDELAILSTCNRTEIYVVKSELGHTEACAANITLWLANYHQIEAALLRRSIYIHAGTAAIRHIMRVATGLDSMVLGEPQILGQLKDGFAMAEANQVLGAWLNRLSQHTYRVAKQARTETAIGQQPVSMASAVVALAAQLFTDLSDCNVMLIGAGEISRLVGRHLKTAGVKKIVIANRSLSNALQLGQALGATATSLSQIPAHLIDTDILITSTSSQLPVLGKGTVERTVRCRHHKPIFMVDLAVPRDIEAEVNDLKDVYLYTLDDLQQIISANIGSRETAAIDAEQFINRAVMEFESDTLSRSAVDTLVRFRQRHVRIKQEELEKFLKRLKNDEDAGKVLEAFANQLTNKIMHIPSVQLKQAAIDGAEHLLTAIEKLYQLDANE